MSFKNDDEFKKNEICCRKKITDRMEIFDAVPAVVSDASSPYTAQAADDMLPWIV